MKLTTIIYFIITLLTITHASDWKNKLTINGSMSLSDVSNWSQGGSDSFSWNTNIAGNFNKTLKNKNTWANALTIDFGQTTISGEQSKTADRFAFLSQYSIGQSKFKPFLSVDVLTQLSQGVNDDGIVDSYSMDPLYITESAGMEYNVNSRLRSQIGIANKQTIVSNSTLTSSNSQLGLGITSFYKTRILTKLELDSSLRFFFASQTLEETDIVGKLSLTYPINTYVKWFYNFNLVYDADISDMVQTQSQNTVGLSLVFK